MVWLFVPNVLDTWSPTLNVDCLGWVGTVGRGGVVMCCVCAYLCAWVVDVRRGVRRCIDGGLGGRVELVEEATDEAGES